MSLRSDHIVPAPRTSAQLTSQASQNRHDRHRIADVADDLEKGPREMSSPHQRLHERSSDSDDGGNQKIKRLVVRKLAKWVLRMLGIDYPSRENCGKALAKNTLAALGIVRAIERSNIVPILWVIDLKFDGTSELVIRLRCVEQEHLQTSLKSLPVQRSQTARIFLCGFPIRERKPPGSTILSFLNDLGVTNAGIPRKADVANSARLAPQWSERGSALCLGVKITGGEEDLSAHIQCIPFETDKLIAVHSFHGEIEDSLKNKWSNNLLASITASHSLFALLSQHSNQMRRDASKFLVLNFLAVASRLSVERLENHARTIKREYRQYGYRNLNYDAVKAYSISASQYETLVDTAKDLSDAIDFVMSSILKSPSVVETTTNISQESDERYHILEEINGTCAQLKKLAFRTQAYYERRYKIYIGALDIHGSQSVKRLTALATGFLPLSLGASLLSMQTRFADLNVLLYDFVGVGLLLFFLMFVTFVLLKLAVKTAKWKPYGRPRLNIGNLRMRPEEARKLQKMQKIQRVAQRVPRIFLICAGIYTTIAFLVGMFDKVSLGLKLWGYGTAAEIGIVIGFPILIIGVFVFLLSLRHLFDSLLRKRRTIPRHELEESDESGFSEVEDSDSS